LRSFYWARSILRIGEAGSKEKISDENTCYSLEDLSAAMDAQIRLPANQTALCSISEKRSEIKNQKYWKSQGL
jgi:hypothetical protein